MAPIIELGVEEASRSFSEVEQAGKPGHPVPFPRPVAHKALRQPAYVLNLTTNERQVVQGVIRRETIEFGVEVLAYMPEQCLHKAIYGSVWRCSKVVPCHTLPTSSSGAPPGFPSDPTVWHTSQTQVAIKIMNLEMVDKCHLAENPIDEVAAMQLLGDNGEKGNDTHVLGIIEVLFDDDNMYSVMPFCRNGDLFEMLNDPFRKSSHLTEPEARHFFRQILQGICHMQRFGISHRDLSLENVFVDGDRCRIADFGLAIRVPLKRDDSSEAGFVRRLVKPQGVVGKLRFMAPEVFANRESFDGFAADLWSAAVILFMLLTGSALFDEASHSDPAFQLIADGQLMTILANPHCTHLSDEACDLLQRMLRVDPRERLSLKAVASHPWTAGEESTRERRDDMPNTSALSSVTVDSVSCN